MTAPDIRVEGLVKRYGRSGSPAVDGMDLEVRPGEFLGLLGPNGAGKTTLIGILTGVLAPTAGTALVRGLDVVKDRERVHRLIGLVPQDIALYDTLTARENLRYFGRLHGLRHEVLNERAEALLERTGLRERADEQVRGWSGGMQRRLNIVAALLHAPPIIFLDEPTVGIDVQSRAAIRELLREINAAGTTVLYTGHHLEEAELLCTRVVVMDHGRRVGEVADMQRGEDRERLEDLFLRLTGHALRD
ncbi:MAG: ABC transporter ATP-binding protein [Flavobacteriales bacterium]|nr:Daunorubicin/doxorubicin resistance ATP-binding protein DrrA [Flavobacteriales bacterium]MCC6577290.1 ABC transporter ATP-binding protein [Flavobacteriales bacterium]NUQ13731.1 ABC transporter ATP-binding protein [Flavobacteriales bacterium]